MCMRVRLCARCHGHPHDVHASTVLLLADGARDMMSSLTLAALEDLGFYVANYSAAQPMRWGLHQGCTFVKTRCAVVRHSLPYFEHPLTLLPSYLSIINGLPTLPLSPHVTSRSCWRRSLLA